MRFLPPYSPDLNPIEQVFAKLKTLLRRAAPPRPAMAMSAAPASAGRSPARDAAVAGPAAALAYAWAQMVLYQRGPDHPLGTPIAAGPTVAFETTERRREDAYPGSRSRILLAGFVGRRKEMHALRRELRAGRHLHVVQGTGGLGKSAFCAEALKVYAGLGWQPLALWCADVEGAADPVTGLLRQFEDAGRALVGDPWDDVLASFDHIAANRQDLRRPASRLQFLLELLLKLPCCTDRWGCRRGAGWRRGTVPSMTNGRVAVPFKANADRRHHIAKQRHQVTNGAEYDAALRRRGSLTVWFTDAAIAAWRAAPRVTPGGQPHYSPLAITTGLTLRAVFRLALRQTEGLIGSILHLLGLDLAVPDHSTMSRLSIGTETGPLIGVLVQVANRRDPRVTRSASTSDGAARAGALLQKSAWRGSLRRRAQDRRS